MPDGETAGVVLVTEVAPYDTPSGRLPAGVHHSLGSAETGLRELAALCDQDFACHSSVRTLSEEHLNAASVLVLLTIGNTPWSAAQRALVLDRVRSGGLAVLGLHCATDASHDWPEYGQLLGARFDGHPVTADLPVAVVDAAHPATEHLPPVWRMHDELYLFRDVAADSRVLLAVRQGPRPHYADGETYTGADIPVAWERTVGRGRVFYTALGHFAAAWENTAYLMHVLGALRVLLGPPAEPEETRP